MMKKGILINTILIFFLISIAYSQEIVYTPIPTTNFENLISLHQPLVEYLRKKTNLPIKLNIIDNYKKVLEEFKAEKIHITVVGPLPFYLLKKNYQHLKLIAVAKERDGSQTYSCVLFTRFDGPESIDHVKGPLALPQKLSTCSLFAANIIFQDSNVDIKKIKYTFFNTHNEVAEAVLGGTHEVGIMHSSLVPDYSGLAIKNIKETPKSWYGFAIVANLKILDQNKINLIKNILLEMKLEEQRQLAFGKNGFFYLSDEEYLKPIQNYHKFIPANLIE